MGYIILAVIQIHCFYCRDKLWLGLRYCKSLVILCCSFVPNGYYLFMYFPCYLKSEPVRGGGGGGGAGVDGLYHTSCNPGPPTLL